MTEKEEIEKTKEQIKEVCACSACSLPLGDVDKVQNYLAEVVERLCDVMTALDGVTYGAQIEKATMVQSGADFRYQQAIIDIANELRTYATGEQSLHDVMRTLNEQRKVMQEGPVPANGVAGYT